jgi:hypothetical protein
VEIDLFQDGGQISSHTHSARFHPHSARSHPQASSHAPFLFFFLISLSLFTVLLLPSPASIRPNSKTDCPVSFLLSSYVAYFVFAFSLPYSFHFILSFFLLPHLPPPPPPPTHIVLYSERTLDVQSTVNLNRS